MGETGGHYCNKKTDDICGDVCGQVIFLFFVFVNFLVSIIVFTVFNRDYCWSVCSAEICVCVLFVLFNYVTGFCFLGMFGDVKIGSWKFKQNPWLV